MKQYTKSQVMRTYHEVKSATCDRCGIELCVAPDRIEIALEIRDYGDDDYKRTFYDLCLQCLKHITRDFQTKQAQEEPDSYAP